MYLQTLQLTNFKNYESLNLELSPGLNGFVGNNGCGKTNILDAVYYLSMCKSYLNSNDRQNIRFDQSFFSISGNWNISQKMTNVHCAFKIGAKKVIKLNKKEYEKISEHIGRFPLVFISPYDGDLIAEGSELRRKWMDGILVQIDREYLEQLQFYAKILDQRNALLKSMFEHRLFDRESMEVWDIQLITAGELIHKKRQQFLEEFIPVFQKCYKEIGGNKEEVGLSYRSQLNEGSFIDLLKDSEKRDAFSQYTNVGIHKDDLLFRINEHPAKKFGSQGQQKSFVIALRLAQYDWLKNHLSISPVLLLDDVFDKLDGKRVQKLIQMVTSLDFGQVIVTDTDIERMRKLFEGLNVPSRIFEVKNQEVEIIHEIEFHESER